MDVSTIKIFKHCFKQISVRDLNNRIDHYRQVVNLKTITEERLIFELMKLFKVDIDGKQSFFFLKSDTMTQQFHRFHFYRIRKFVDEDYERLEKKNFLSMQTEQDVWTRPAKDVKIQGRLNRIGESMFYAAAQATNAIYETSVEESELFFLMVYENRKQMRLSQIHYNSHMDEFDELENAKLTILHNFLLAEFTKIVISGQEYNYKSSIAIFQKFFNSPEIDGFTYPSIKTQENLGFNICFNAKKARENLKFCGMMVCQLGPPSLNSAFQFRPIYDGFLNDTGGYDFFQYNSEQARKKFGDFGRIRDMGL